MPMLEDLSWLAGRWSFERDGRITTETWTAPVGGMMTGVGQTVFEGQTLFFESLSIHEDEGPLAFTREVDGLLFYTAIPNGQKETTFTSREITEKRVVFENPLHDFPQTIGYELQPNGDMLAWIEGPDKNGASPDGRKRIEFPYQRVG